MPKEIKWAKDDQEERNETKEPTSNVMGQESPKWHEYKYNDHIESLREEQEAGPASTGQKTPRQEQQSGMAGMATRLRKEQRMGQRGENP